MTTSISTPHGERKPEPIQLFRVYSLLPEFDGHKNVAMNWFVSERKEPLVLPYESLIEEYDASNSYPRGALDEMFTEAEANALVGYLKEFYGDNPKIEKQSLPIPSNRMGNGAIAVGGPQDFLMISKRETYRLPFEVFGYYDLRHAADGPFVEHYRQTPHDIDPDGDIPY